MKRCLYILLCTTPLMGMEFSSPATKKELKEELNRQRSDLAMHKSNRKDTKRHLFYIEKRQQLPLEKSPEKQLWLKQNIGKSIYDFDQKLQSLKDDVLRDLLNTNKRITEITYTIDSLQRRLYEPYQRESHPSAD